MFSSNLTLARTSAVVTILNDDWPQVTVTNVTVNEGNSGRTNAAFRVTLSAKPPFPVEVLFRTVPLTASAQSDFISREGWIHFEPNEDVKTIAVPVLGDTAYELNETAAFVLLDKANAEFLTGQAVLTIRNDDLPPVPTLAIARQPDGALRFDFDTVLGATYQLQSTTNLTVMWQLLPATVTGSGMPAALMLSSPSEHETYYRLKVQ